MGLVFRTSVACKFTLILILWVIFVSTYLFIISSEIPLVATPFLASQSIINDFTSVHREWQKQEQTCPALVDIKFKNTFVAQFVRKETLSCPYSLPFTYVTEEGLILCTDDKPRNVSCYCSYLSPTPNQKNYIDYQERQEITASGVQLTKFNTIANVSCLDEQNENVYKNTHLFIPKFFKHRNSVNLTKEYRPSVLIYFIESLSKLSFKRFMKETQAAIDSLNHVKLFENFVKPMEGSIHNKLALLTGERIDNEFDQHLMNDYFDRKLPFIWEDFAAQGYVTGITEDVSPYDLFHHGMHKGFRDQPVDWYPRSFWIQMHPELAFWDRSKLLVKQQYCFANNGPNIQIFNNQVESFVKKQLSAELPFFLVASYSQMTHENFNNFQMIDTYYADFIRRMKPLLNETILIFAGDHGPRYGAVFTETSLGQIEENMPLVTIRIPDTLDALHPQLRKYLDANADRLTTWYDFHQLLKNVVTHQFNPMGFEYRKSGPLSPWRELVPPTRTCDDANIDPAYCVCNNSIGINTSKLIPHYACIVLTNYVNEVIENEIRGKAIGRQSCMAVIGANFLIDDEKQNWFKERLNITIQIKPSRQLITATLITDYYSKHRNMYVEATPLLDYEIKRKLQRSCIISLANCFKTLETLEMFVADQKYT